MRRFVLPLMLLVLVALGAWWIGARGPQPASAPLPPPSAENGIAAHDASDLEAGAQRARAATDLPVAPKVAEPPSATVRAHCIDDRGLPIAGVELGGDSNAVVARSGVDGRVEGHWRLGRTDGQMSWITLREPFHLGQLFLRVLVPDALCDLGDVVLVPAGRIRGRIVNERGKPVSGAFVWSTRADKPLGGQDSSAASAVDGNFVLDAVPCGPTRVTARARGYVASERSGLELLAGQELRGIEIALTERESEDAAGFLVRVWTPAGEALPLANLVCDIREKRGQSVGTWTADEHGTLKLPIGPEARVNLRATDPAGRFAPACAFDVPASSGSLDLRLGATSLHTLLVEDQSGKPVESFAFRVLQAPESTPLPGLERTDARGLLRCSLPDAGTDSSFGVDPEQRQSHPEGRAELRAPATPFVIQLDAPDCALSQVGPLVPESLPAEVRVTLQRLPGIRGIVTAEGKPVAGAWVKLFAAPGRKRETLVDDFPSHVMAAPELATSTDEQGRFALELREAGDYEVQAGAPERGVAEFGPVHLVPDKGAQELVLELPALGALEGRVLANPGVVLRDLVVGASRGDGRPLSVRTDADGRFRFDKLSPGRWFLRLVEGDIDPHGETTQLRDEPASEAPFPANCEVRGGETAHADIDLRQSAELVARVELAGWEGARWHASLEPEGATQCRGLRIDDVDGEHVRLLVDQPGDYRFWLNGTLPGAQHSLGFEELVHLEAGPNTWKFASPTGTLVLANRKDEELSTYVRCRLAGGRELSLNLQLAAQGELTLSGIPLGSWARLDWRDDLPVEDGTTEVSAGTPGRLEWN